MIDIIAQGNQLKVTGFGSNPLYDNIDDLDIEVNGDDIRIVNFVKKITLLPDTVYSDFNTPSGASAEIVADAISDLMAGAAGGTSDVVVTDPTDAASPTSVAGSATSVELLAANANRTEAIIRNDSTAILYIQEGASATTSSAIRLIQHGTVIITSTLVVNGIWESATGNARITEKTKT